MLKVPCKVLFCIIVAIFATLSGLFWSYMTSCNGIWSFNEFVGSLIMVCRWVVFLVLRWL